MGRMAEKILGVLQESSDPIPGTALADQIGVSRQAVVQHIAVLRAQGMPITASSRGYLLNHATGQEGVRSVFMVQHGPDLTQQELYALVDAGLTVVDVLVEHPVYGELSGGLNLRSRADVDEFLLKTQVHMGGLLSSLTQGIHWHTVHGQKDVELRRGREALKQLGIWLGEGRVSPEESRLHQGESDAVP